MKHYLNKLLLGVLVLAVIAGCNKDENQVVFEGGTAPVLTASSTAPLTLNIAQANLPAISFSWTNPNYRFNTGMNSQDVTYALQVDTAGANFGSGNMQQVSIAKDLSLNLTVKELNTILAKLNVKENVAHNVEFRIKSSLGNNSVPLYSNVIKVTITPYLDVVVPVPPTGELYMTGDAMGSGWTNTPPANQKFTKISNTEFEIVVALTPGKFYKFLSTQGAWQPQYGGSSATGGDMGYNMGGGSDPDAIPTPGVAGNYKINVNFKTGKYTVVLQ